MSQTARDPDTSPELSASCGGSGQRVLRALEDWSRLGLAHSCAWSRLSPAARRRLRAGTRVGLPTAFAAVVGAGSVTLHQRHHRRARDPYTPDGLDRAAFFVPPSPQADTD